MIEITINCDASFNNSIGAWAYWIDTPEGIMKQAGLIEEPVDNPSVAELIGFQQAFQRLCSEYEQDTRFNITLYCDNLWVVRAMTGDIRRYPNTRNIHIAQAKSIYRDLRFHKIKAIHVRGHGPRLETPEQKANNWCDFNARELVRREITKRNAGAKA